MGSSNDPGDPLATAVRLVSELLTTPDRDLAALAQRIGGPGCIDSETLWQAREILEFVAMALTTTDASHRLALRQAHEAVARATRPERGASIAVGVTLDGLGPPTVVANRAPSPVAPAIEAQDDSTEASAPAVDGTTVVAGDRPPIPRGVPDLTVEQYASLCAECAVAPDRVGEIQVRYQIPSDGARRVVDRLWQDKLATDAELYRRWEQCCLSYRAWLIQGRRFR